MYRTIVFTSTFPDKWTFDENENPTAPGARELANAIAAKLRCHVQSVSPVQQHEYYGWGFGATTDDSTFYNVLNPGDECYLTVSMNWYALKAILFRHPSNKFAHYCGLIAEVLREIPEISEVRWQANGR